MVSRFGTLDRSVDGGDRLSELSREWPGLKCIETLVELLYLGYSKDHPIAMISVQDALERCPSQRSCVSADTVLLSGSSNSGHRSLDGRLTIKRTVYFADDVLVFC